MPKPSSIRTSAQSPPALELYMQNISQRKLAYLIEASVSEVVWVISDY